MSEEQKIGTAKVEHLELKDYIPRTVFLDLESRVVELENTKNPLTIEGRIQNLFTQIDEITGKISEIMQKFKAINTDDKYMEIFTDDELRSFYAKSNISMNQVKSFVEREITKTDNPVSLQLAAKYVNGAIKDVRSRSVLGKYLREQAVVNKEV